MYRAVTRNIEVVVVPRFVADRSSPENNYFFWAYTISITNNGSETVQLKTRHWRITDANGRRQEVRGAGVVGEEPVLKAGEAFEYTSGVPLQTSSGFMVGTYGMVTAERRAFRHRDAGFLARQRRKQAHAQLRRGEARFCQVTTGHWPISRPPAGRSHRLRIRSRNRVFLSHCSKIFILIKSISYAGFPPNTGRRHIAAHKMG